MCVSVFMFVSTGCACEGQQRASGIDPHFLPCLSQDLVLLCADLAGLQAPRGCPDSALHLMVGMLELQTRDTVFGFMQVQGIWTQVLFQRQMFYLLSHLSLQPNL